MTVSRISIILLTISLIPSANITILYDKSLFGVSPIMQTQESGQLTSDMTTSPPSARQAWRDFSLPWWQATKAVLPVYLITRLVFLLLTYFSGILFFVPNYSTEQLSIQ